MRSDLKIRTTARAPPANASEHVLDLASPCTTNRSSCCKENININQSETPKLCLEPLQMKKRKKKIGGHNLRKSLAWDRAFFTEEGVLDPVELSVISGASCTEGLPFINGDTLGSPQLPIKPLDTQKLEKDLLKEMQDEDVCKDGNKHWSSPKIDSSSSTTVTSTSLTSHKFPKHLGNRSGPRCGDCPRPLPSSSSSSSSYPLVVMQSANVNVGKAVGKDLKLLKLPGLISSLSPVCATTTSTVNCVKHNQITKPDFNIQRNTGSKSFSKSFQNTKSASKASSLRPPRYSDGSSGNSSFKRLSSVNLNHVLVDNSDNPYSKMISDIATPARQVNSSMAQQESTSFADPFYRNAHAGGTTIHPSQNQPMRPSRLRMPSPSLSYFSQPKHSVFHDLPLRDKEIDVCGSQKPDNLRLQGNLRRTPKIDNKITACAISSSKTINSVPEHIASSYVSAAEVINPNMERKPMYKIPDISKNRTGRIIHEERELQKIDIELPSESGSCEQVTDDKCFRKAIKEYREEACKLDYHQPHREPTDPPKDTVGETDKRTGKDKNTLQTEERASEHLCVSQQCRNWIHRSESTESLEHIQAKAKNSYFESKHPRANLLEETAFTDATDILADHRQNAVFALSVVGCRYGTNLLSEVDDDSNLSEEGMEPSKNVESNTSNRLLPEKHLCHQTSQQEENVEKLIVPETSQKEENVDKLIFVVPDRKCENKVMDTKTASSLSPSKMHDCNFHEDKVTGQLLVSTEFNFVDESLSPKSHSSLVDVSLSRDFKDKPNVLQNNPAIKILSNSLHQDIQMEIEYCSSYSESRTHEGSQDIPLGNVTDTGATIQDGSAENWFTSKMSLKESESGINNLGNLLDSGSVLVQSPDSNMLNECCVKESERLTLSSAESIVENAAHHNHKSHFGNFTLTKCQADASYVDNAMESMENSVTGQNKLYFSTSRSTNFPAKETPLTDECDDAYGIRGYPDVIPDLSRIEPLSGTSTSEVSEDTKSYIGCFHPKSDNANVASAFTPNKHEDSLNEKSILSILPQKALPFSDEWLAAVEAAGEILKDILTKKSGAVQNSPPDKSLPEPGPWSPKSGEVKRKNNHIGPFDCTKFTNIVPSDTN
ncbi:hypothetical protein OROMI_011539 [Orobanche minor]